MKKILIIHNKYREVGGEDIAVENEINLLKKSYEVKVLYFNNNFQSFINTLISFLHLQIFNQTELLRRNLNNLILTMFIFTIPGLKFH